MFCRQSFLLAPLPKESLSRCGEFEILGRDLQKHGLRTAIELSGLPQAVGMGDDLSVFSSPHFYLRLCPRKLQINK